MNEARQQEFSDEMDALKKEVEGYLIRRAKDPREFNLEMMPRFHRLIDNLDRRLRKIEQKIS